MLSRDPTAVSIHALIENDLRGTRNSGQFWRPVFNTPLQKKESPFQLVSLGDSKYGFAFSQASILEQYQERTRLGEGNYSESPYVVSYSRIIGMPPGSFSGSRRGHETLISGAFEGSDGSFHPRADRERSQLDKQFRRVLEPNL